MREQITVIKISAIILSVATIFFSSIGLAHSNIPNSVNIDNNNAINIWNDYLSILSDGDLKKLDSVSELTINHFQTSNFNQSTDQLSNFYGQANLTATNPESITPLPLPATIVLFGSALTGFIGFTHWRQKSQKTRPYQTIELFGIKFTNLTYDRAINIFQDWIISKQPHQVCFTNVHTAVSCLKDKELRNINNHSLNAMDGLPIVWYANLVHNRGKSNRVCGPDLMQKCLDEGRKRDWTHFFLGGTEAVLEDLVKNVETKFPGVNIVGRDSPPFRQLTAEEDALLVEKINAAKPDFLWVGLGAPKQEKWIAAHLDRVHAPVQLGVGAAFSFHSGHIKRAPLWMQKNGLEWLYRLSKERRLLRRYVETNAIFLLFFIRDLFLIRFLKVKSS